MSTRSILRTASTTALGICAITVACSTSNSSGSASSSLVPLLDAGFPGCEPEAPGCYTVSGTYPLPSVSPSCTNPGGPSKGTADTHCQSVPPQTVTPAACSLSVAPSEDAGVSAEAGATADAGAAEPPAGSCGEDSADYGHTMFGTEGSDDDCKYDVSYTTSPICEQDGTYFVVTAKYLSRNGAPLTGACAFAELCLNDTHPAPPADSRPPQGSQKVVEGPPGTYTIGPVVFDAAGQWTVRFHFNELCCDVSSESPHGHAAFHVDVP